MRVVAQRRWFEEGHHICSQRINWLEMPEPIPRPPIPSPGSIARIRPPARRPARPPAGPLARSPAHPPARNLTRSHTRTCARAHAHTHGHTHTHARTHGHARTCKNTHARKHSARPPRAGAAAADDVLYWLNFSLSLELPHIELFDGFDELLGQHLPRVFATKSPRAALRERSAAMRDANAERKAAVSELWARTLARIKQAWREHGKPELVLDDYDGVMRALYGLEMPDREAAQVVYPVTERRFGLARRANRPPRAARRVAFHSDGGTLRTSRLTLYCAILVCDACETSTREASRHSTGTRRAS